MLNIYVSCYSVNIQKQPSIDVFQKRCSAKTQQIHLRSPMENVISMTLHSKNSSINLSAMSTSLDDIKIKVITMLLTSVMLAMIYCDWFYY